MPTGPLPTSGQVSDGISELLRAPAAGSDWGIEDRRVKPLAAAAETRYVLASTRFKDNLAPELRKEYLELDFILGQARVTEPIMFRTGLMQQLPQHRHTIFARFGLPDDAGEALLDTIDAAHSELPVEADKMIQMQAPGEFQWRVLQWLVDSVSGFAMVGDRIRGQELADILHSFHGQGTPDVIEVLRKLYGQVWDRRTSTDIGSGSSRRTDGYYIRECSNGGLLSSEGGPLSLSYWTMRRSRRPIAGASPYARNAPPSRDKSSMVNT